MQLFLADQRNRLREAATSLIELTERVPGGLGEVRVPLLSASDDEPVLPSVGHVEPSADIVGAPRDAVDDSGVDDAAVDDSGDAEPVADARSRGASDTIDDNLRIVTVIADEHPVATADAFDPWDDVAGEPTTAMPVVPAPNGDDTDRNDFRFSFDDDRR